MTKTACLCDTKLVWVMDDGVTMTVLSITPPTVIDCCEKDYFS